LVESRSSSSTLVLIADDDGGVRTLIQNVLELEGFDTVTVSTGTEALEAALAERPSVAILDVKLPGLSGYEVCDAIHKRYGESLPILLISGERVESFDRVAGLLIGADDYLVKPLAPDELCARVRALLRRVSQNGSSSLTPREREVLQLLAEGLPQSEIADRLVISSKTVASHIERILAKLGVRSRAQAVAAAFREGLVSTLA
jgi:two-component system, OmpR family, response regulator MprA